MFFYSDSYEVEKEFSQSKIKEYLREIISILKSDTDTLSEGLYMADLNDDLGSCFDYFIQFHMVREFCIRAIKDTPRGFLPLILNFVASVFQNVSYPLLPQVSIHKAVANLLFFSYHYESLQLKESKVLHVGPLGELSPEWIYRRNQTSANSYQRRIGTYVLSRSLNCLFT